MSFLTKSLSGQVGIQAQQSFSQAESIANQTNLLMIIENVPRGRLDKPMLITPKNIHEKLGRRVGSMHLQALYDVFDTGVKKATVLRVSGLDEVESQNILYNNTIRHDGVYNHDN